MPASLVSRMGLRRELTDFKSVLSDARNQVLVPVDVEAMAQSLVEAGGREFVEMVRELTIALANTRQDLEAANRQCERLKAELEKRGVLADEPPPQHQPAESAEPPPEPAATAQDEWEEWDKRFRSLLERGDRPQ